MTDEHDDIQLDNENENLDDSVLAEEHMGDTVKKLREKLKGAENKAKEYLDSWQRAQAEFVNIRKRDEEAKADFLKFAKSDILEELIPVLDSFELSLRHGSRDTEPIYNQFLKVLRDHGLSEINPLGETFDPKMHEALGMIPTDKMEDDHKVLEVFQKGYMLIDRVIRPAKVRIGEYKS
jgi:molecular chaperone GrpE